MCTCERFLVGIEYRTKQKKKKKKGENENWNEPFFHLECQNSNSFFFTAKMYIKQVYLEEGGQIRYIW